MYYDGWHSLPLFLISQTRKREIVCVCEKEKERERQEDVRTGAKVQAGYKTQSYLFPRKNAALLNFHLIRFKRNKSFFFFRKNQSSNSTTKKHLRRQRKLCFCRSLRLTYILLCGKMLIKISTIQLVCS